MSKKIKKQDLEKRFQALEEKLKNSNTLLHELIEFCERTGVLPPEDPTNFSNWREKLATMRREDQLRQEIKRARQVLEHHDYLVVEHKNELDAAKVKKWVQNK